MAKSPSAYPITKDIDAEKPLSEFNSDNTIQYLSITSITNRMQFLRIYILKIYTIYNSHWSALTMPITAMQVNFLESQLSTFQSVIQYRFPCFTK